MRAPAVQTEAQFEVALVEAARLLGWRVVHFRPARTGDGWRTAVAYDGAGWPDLVLVRDRLVVAELKGPRGSMTARQIGWVAALEHAGVETYVWRPEDFDAALAVLTRRIDDG